MRRISVEPSGNEWVVRSDQNPKAVIFHSGREAELAAKQMGRVFADAGYATEIEIFIRGGALAGRLVCAANAHLIEPLRTSARPQARSA